MRHNPVGILSSAFPHRIPLRLSERDPAYNENPTSRKKDARYIDLRRHHLNSATPSDTFCGRNLCLNWLPAVWRVASLVYRWRTPALVKVIRGQPYDIWAFYLHDLVVGNVIF